MLRGTKLTGKNAVIIGGTSRIGSAIVSYLLDRGARIVVTGRKPAGAYKNARKDTLRVAYVELELEEKVDLVKVESSVANFLESKVHILVYLVGPVLYKSLHKTSVQEFEYLLKTNVVGFQDAVCKLQKFFPRNDYARIIAFACAGADNLSAKRLMPAYFAAKTALVSLVKSYSVELAPFGITVNAIAPGWIESGGERLKNIIPKIPSGRTGTIAELVNAVGFLLEPDSKYVTGTVITVSGGYSV